MKSWFNFVFQLFSNAFWVYPMNDLTLWHSTRWWVACSRLFWIIQNHFMSLELPYYLSVNRGGGVQMRLQMFLVLFQIELDSVFEFSKMFPNNNWAIHLMKILNYWMTHLSIEVKSWCSFPRNKVFFNWFFGENTKFQWLWILKSENIW